MRYWTMLRKRLSEFRPAVNRVPRSAGGVNVQQHRENPELASSNRAVRSVFFTEGFHPCSGKPSLPRNYPLDDRQELARPSRRTSENFGSAHSSSSSSIAVGGTTSSHVDPHEGGRRIEPDCRQGGGQRIKDRAGSLGCLLRRAMAETADMLTPTCGGCDPSGSFRRVLHGGHGARRKKPWKWKSIHESLTAQEMEQQSRFDHLRSTRRRR